MANKNDDKIEIISLDSLPDEDTFDEDTKNNPDSILSPERQDEISISGSMPDPDSDDDTLKNAHQVGEQVTEDLEHPKTIGLDRDINKAEKIIEET